MTKCLKFLIFHLNWTAGRMIKIGLKYFEERGYRLWKRVGLQPNQSSVEIWFLSPRHFTLLCILIVSFMRLEMQISQKSSFNPFEMRSFMRLRGVKLHMHKITIGFRGILEVIFWKGLYTIWQSPYYYHFLKCDLQHGNLNNAQIRSSPWVFLCSPIFWL